MGKKSRVIHAISSFLIILSIVVSSPIILQGFGSNDIVSNAEAASKTKLNKSDIYITVGNSITLKLSGTNKKVTWSSKDNKIATVKKGNVFAKKKGSTTITAKVSGKKYNCKVVVENPSINISKKNMDIGDSVTLKIKNTKQDIKWSSSNSSVAEVFSDGWVIALDYGTAVITGKVGGLKYKCIVTVKNANSSSDTNNDVSRTVYVTPTGKRYHFSPTCGGKNSRESTLNYAVNTLGLTPCKKCVH
ncbi:Ig-like domain-containing protein [Lachnospiraceae bacterium ZAX-1]